MFLGDSAKLQMAVILIIVLPTFPSQMGMDEDPFHLGMDAEANGSAILLKSMTIIFIMSIV